MRVYSSKSDKLERYKGWKLKDKKAFFSANFELLTKNARERGEFLPAPNRNRVNKRRSADGQYYYVYD